MAKKRRSRHRIPACALELKSDPIDERYQTEVDYATNRLQRRYERAVKARDAAQRRLALALTQSAKASRLAELRRQVEMREYELGEIVRLMQPANRAKVGWRPMPVTHAEPF
jgi:hypothetical protein